MSPVTLKPTVQVGCGYKMHVHIPQTIIAFFLGLYTQNDLADVHGNIIAELWPPPALTISAHAVYIYIATSFPCQFIYFGSSMKHGVPTCI